MIKKIKTTLLSFSAALALLLPAVTPVAVYAQPSIQKGACQGANNLQLGNVAASGTGTDCEVTNETTTLNNILTSTVNIISVIVGVVAVIMIIVGGFRYVTSGGSAEKVGGAKNTILYGIIGLIIVALAQVLVRFVLQAASNQV